MDPSPTWSLCLLRERKVQASKTANRPSHCAGWARETNRKADLTIKALVSLSKMDRKLIRKTDRLTQCVYIYTYTVYIYIKNRDLLSVPIERLEHKGLNHQDSMVFYPFLWSHGPMAPIPRLFLVRMDSHSHGDYRIPNLPSGYLT